MQTLGRDVSVALDHVRGLPAAEALKLMGRGSGLTVPGGERVPQIVPLEVLDPCSRQGRVLGFGVHVGHRGAPIREHAGQVLADLLVQNPERHFVQRHRVRRAVLVLCAGYPCVTQLKVDVLPFQTVLLR